MKYLFQKEIHIVAVQRSGIHAIVNWLIGHFDEAIYLPDAAVDFYNSSYPFEYYKNGVEINRTETIKPSECAIFDHQNSFPIAFKDLDKDETYLRVTKKAVEEFNVDLFSKERYIILHIRDPFNNFASLYKLFGDVKKSKIEVWKQLAIFYINHSDEFIYSNYNEWFQSRSYREKLIKQIGLQINDKNFRKMLRHGGGSSFSKMNYKQDASQLDVMNRWKIYKNDESFMSLFDNEIVELSNQIFGDIV